MMMMNWRELGKWTVLIGCSAVCATGVEAKSSANPAATNKKAEVIKPADPATPQTLPPLEQPLITVDGVPITTQDYINFLQTHPTIISRAASSEAGKTEALREMTRTFLLRKALYDDGLLPKDDKEPSPNAVAGAYEKLAKQHFPVPPAPDDKTAHAYYQAHQENYGIPGSVRLNQILFKTPNQPETAVLKAAEERATAALKRLEAGEKFSVVASELTESPIGKVTGGDMGFIEPGEQTWLQEPLKGMKVGDRKGPVQGPEGVVILELTDTRPALIAPYANVRDKVIKDIRDEAQKKVRDAYVMELAKKAKIVAVAPSVQPLFPNGVLP